MNFSNDIYTTFDSIEVNQDMKEKIMNVSQAKRTIDRNNARIRRRKSIKALISFAICLVCLYTAANISAYAATGESIYTLFFNPKENHDYQGISEKIYQGFTVEDYRFEITEAIYERNTMMGCVIVRVTKNGEVPPISLDEDNHLIGMGFGDEERFVLAPYSNQAANYTIENNALYVCVFYTEDVENSVRFTLVDRKGPKVSGEEFTEYDDDFKVISSGVKCNDDYVITNLGEAHIWYSEGGFWDWDTGEFVDAQDIEMWVDLTGGNYCLKGDDQAGTCIYISPFGYIADCAYNREPFEVRIHLNNGTELYYGYDKSMVASNEDMTRFRYTYQVGFAERLDLDQVKYVMINGERIDVSMMSGDERRIANFTEADFEHQSDDKLSQRTVISDETKDFFSEWASDLENMGYLLSPYHETDYAEEILQDYHDLISFVCVDGYQNGSKYVLDFALAESPSEIISTMTVYRKESGIEIRENELHLENWRYSPTERQEGNVTIYEETYQLGNISYVKTRSYCDESDHVFYTMTNEVGIHMEEWTVWYEGEAIAGASIDGGTGSSGGWTDSSYCSRFTLPDSYVRVAKSEAVYVEGKSVDELEFYDCGELTLPFAPYMEEFRLFDVPDEEYGKYDGLVMMENIYPNYLKGVGDIIETTYTDRNGVKYIRHYEILELIAE